MPVDTESLLSRIASGDREAFASFYEEWFVFVLGQCRRVSRGDEHASADLAQEVFMKVIRRTPMMDSPAALGAWLKRAAVSTALDRAKAESRRRGRERGRAAYAAWADRADESCEWLRSELSIIDAATRDLLRQRFGLGRTLSQIGASLGLSPSAVDGRIGRALRGLLHRAREGGHAD